MGLYSILRNGMYSMSEIFSLKTLDMGCVVEKGGFFIDYDGEENIKISDANKRIIDYYDTRIFKSLEVNPKEKSLVAFFLQLSRYLQQSIGTVAAIDFNAYGNSLGIKIDQL